MLHSSQNTKMSLFARANFPMIQKGSFTHLAADSRVQLVTEHEGFHSMRGALVVLIHLACYYECVGNIISFLKSAAYVQNATDLPNA